MNVKATCLCSLSEAPKSLCTHCTSLCNDNKGFLFYSITFICVTSRPATPCYQVHVFQFCLFQISVFPVCLYPSLLCDCLIIPYTCLPFDYEPVLWFFTSALEVKPVLLNIACLSESYLGVYLVPNLIICMSTGKWAELSKQSGEWLKLSACCTLCNTGMKWLPLSAQKNTLLHQLLSTHCFQYWRANVSYQSSNNRLKGLLFKKNITLLLWLERPAFQFAHLVMFTIKLLKWL